MPSSECGDARFSRARLFGVEFERALQLSMDSLRRPRRERLAKLDVRGH